MNISQFVLITSLMIPSFAHAEAIASAESNGVKITLFKDDCTLKEISNLRFHAEWAEHGKVTQGCWSLHPVGLVLMYFADKTMMILPAQEFEVVSTI